MREFKKLWQMDKFLEKKDTQRHSSGLYLMKDFLSSYADLKGL